MADLSFRVDYFNNEHKELIRKNFPIDFKLTEEVNNKTINVPHEDFKVYTFFRHQCDSDGFRTFTDIKKLCKNWSEFDLHFKYIPADKKLVHTYPAAPDTSLSETLGIAGGLAVASYVYGLTQADWTRLPNKRYKDFDYRLLSCTNHRFINIETKGSVVTNNIKPTPAVHNHARSITNKKKDDNFKAKYNYSQETCLGFITVADKNNILKSWILDPPFDNIIESPRKIKLLKRLYYYFQFIKVISKSSNLVLALANKISTIEQIDNYESLDNLKLINQNFERIEINDSFITSRDRTKSANVLGKTFFDINCLIFIGLAADCFDLIINQNFNAINEYNHTPRTNKETIVAKVVRNRKSKIDILLSKVRLINKNDPRYIHFEFEADLIQNSAGLCIAKLDLY